MVECDAIGDCLLGNDGVGGMGGGRVGCGGVGEDVARWSGWWQMELPEVGGGGARAAKEGSAVEGDGDGVGGEGGDATMVAEFADGDEGARCEGWTQAGGLRRRLGGAWGC